MKRYESDQKLTRRQWLMVGGLFGLYIVLRLLAWKSTILLEDHDSISYLDYTSVFRRFSLREILELSPDSTPAYPLFSALFSLPLGSVEAGARLCSLFFSGLLFWALFGIGQRIGRWRETLTGLTLLAFSAPLISLSIGVLTEPTYIALVYCGFWLFLAQYEAPNYWMAVFLGCVFGLTFLTRTEGILYLAFVPLLQTGHLVLSRAHRYGLRRLVGWSLAFALAFALVSAPQVWRVSRKLGSFAINGRQVWSLIMNRPDGKSYDEKVYGLDYGQAQINLEYIRDHSDIQAELTSVFNPAEYIKRVVVNAEDLYEIQLGVLIGPLVLIVFALGLLVLYRRNSVETSLLLAFILLAVIAPLLHNVVIRHIAVILPMVLVVAGTGAWAAIEWIREVHSFEVLSETLLASLVVAVLVAGDGPSLRRVFNGAALDRWSNREYRPADLERPAEMVRQIADSALQRRPVVSARKSYLAHMAGAKQVWLPYTDYAGLVTYAALNEVDFVFLEYYFLQQYPFLEQFSRDSLDGHFVLLYVGQHSTGHRLELYRFRSDGSELSQRQ